jgi:hypothetical protein
VAGVLIFAVASGLTTVRLWGQSPATDASKFPRLNWQPTNASPGAHYLGSETCAGCHADKFATPPTPMTRAMELGSTCEILRKHPLLTFEDGPYTYRITHAGGASTYSISDGHQTISEPILWAFGQGEAGQTYVIRHNGTLYETRVSFFADTQKLDITIGYPHVTPHSLEEAIGHEQAEQSARLCFGCHSTAAVSGSRLQLDQLTPGVTCEGCHYAGADHLAAVQRGDKANPHIFNPGKLNAGDLSDFCGSCHRSGLQVVLMHSEGINTVRFQPYRLSNSRCYDPEDARISCIACHDPHQTVVRNSAFYDGKCLACHGAVAKSAATPHPKTCPVAKRDCSSCHMPKYDLPGGHFKFTDHMIRVARPGEPYPN